MESAQPLGGGLVPHEIAKYWWIPVVIGVFAEIAGILVIVYPGRTLLLLELAFGLYLIFLGVLRFVGAFFVSGGTGGQRVFEAIIGLLAIAAGILVVSTPGFGLATLAVIFAIWLMATGVIALYLATQSPEHRVWNVIRGLLGIAAGIIVIVQPDIGLVTLAVVGGIYLILAGAADIALGLAVRRAGQAA